MQRRCLECFKLSRNLIDFYRNSVETIITFAEILMEFGVKLFASFVYLTIFTSA